MIKTTNLTIKCTIRASPRWAVRATRTAAHIAYTWMSEATTGIESVVCRAGGSRFTGARTGGMIFRDLDLQTKWVLVFARTFARTPANRGSG